MQLARFDHRKVRQEKRRRPPPRTVCGQRTAPQIAVGKLLQFGDGAVERTDS
jgi:hypothetical protein